MSPTATLRHVDPSAPRGPIYRAYVRLASGRFATWLSTKWIWSATVWKIDPCLMRLTRGRLGTGVLPLPPLCCRRAARARA